MRQPFPPRPTAHGRRQHAPAGLLLAALAAAALAATMVAVASGAASQGDAPSASQVAAQTPPAGQAAATADLQHGERLFVGTCAACHGLHGQGAGMPGLSFPPLDASSDAWQKSAVELELIIKGGKGTMPGVGSSWSLQDLRDVMGLLESWWTPEQQAKHDALSNAPDP